MPTQSDRSHAAREELNLIQDVAHETWSNNPYMVRELQNRTAQVHAPLRQIVADHIFRHHRVGSGLKMFSMPSPTWNVESRLMSLIINANNRVCEYFNFLGLFRHAGECFYASQHMPGRDRKDLHTAVFPRGSGISGFESRSAQAYHCELRTFLELDEVPKRLTGWTCLWIDSGLPFSSLFPLLPRIPRFLKKKGGPIPFAFSFILGRDDPQFAKIYSQFCNDPLSARAELLREQLIAGGARGVVINRRLKYGSSADNPQSFGLVCGILETSDQWNFIEESPIGYFSAGIPNGR